MASSSEGDPTPVAITVEKQPETLVSKVEETQATVVSEIGAESSGSNIGASSSTNNDPEKALEKYAELLEKGSKAIKDGDFSEATDCLSRAVEIRVAHYGELAPECASAYYKYGCALLYKAQEEADPLGVVPKSKKEVDSLKNSEKDENVKIIKNGECSTASHVSDPKQEGDSNLNEGETDDGASEREQVEDDGDEESEDEDLADADEDDSDLDLAWKMLDIARAIVEKHPEDTMEKVDILSALGEVALEREDIETSISDYLKALSVLERLVEPDSRQIAELNFRICLCLEVGSKPEEAIPYCQKAISVCKVRVQRLMDEVKNSTGSAATVADVNQVCHSSGDSQSDTPVSYKESEIETLNGLSSELEKKLEDLQQLVLSPSSVFAEVLKMFSSTTNGGEKGASSTVLSSPQMGTDSSGAGTDSPTVSAAQTNGSSGVTHLGVVGRGVKRAVVTPVSAEPNPLKKPSLDSNGEGSFS